MSAEMTAAEEAALRELEEYYRNKPNTLTEFLSTLDRSHEWMRRIEIRALSKMRRIATVHGWAPEKVRP